MGYHIKQIKKGVYGEFSKILEEVQELEDAISQSNKIMTLVELSDLMGSIQGFLQKNHPSISINDLIKMAEATKSAFMDGSRK